MCRQDVIKHVATVHLKIKAYECDKCNFATIARPHLKAHQNAIHFLIKPFKCDECSFSSSYKCALTKDQNNIHGDLTLQKATLNSNIKKVHKEVLQIFKCDSCDFIANQMDPLKQHEDSFHSQIDVINSFDLDLLDA